MDTVHEDLLRIERELAPGDAVADAKGRGGGHRARHA